MSRSTRVAAMDKTERNKAAVLIQRAYRAHVVVLDRKLLEKKNDIIVSIQKVARGYNVRTSEKYTLAQIYLKLPPFWREIMKIKPASNRREMQGKIQPYQISELKTDAKKMLEHILDDVVTDRILPPKLPFLVPQPFDKDPYVSLSDGRRLNYNNLSKSLLNNEYIQATKDNKNFVVSADSMKYYAGRQAAQDLLKAQGEIKAVREPIHSFNLKFWPITQKPAKPDTSTNEHDPALNSFDIICNKRTALSCEVCRTRLRIIQCNTCMKGYCFFCAFRTHTKAFKRNHLMSIMEPRIVKYKEVKTSLVYHVDMAQSVAHDLSYLVKYMRSAAEVKRIQRERQLLKEFEHQEEARRIAFLKASEEMKDFHTAASRLNCMYRASKAKRIVANKRLQLKLENALQDEFKHNNAIVTVQRTMRMVSTRAWLHSFGKDFDPVLTRHKGGRVIGKKKVVPAYKAKLKGKKPPLNKEAVEVRLARDLRLRIAQARQVLLSAMETDHAQVKQLLEANVKYWRQKYDTTVPEVDTLVKQRDALYEEHKARSQENTMLNLTATPEDRDRRELHVKGLHIKLEAVSARVENSRNMLWWMVQHLRCLYRKISIIAVRFADTLRRIEWISVEFAILRRMEFHMKDRIHRMRESVREMHPVADWITNYLNLVIKQQILLDSLQETIIREEINRLMRDNRVTVEFDSLVEELLNSLVQDNQYIAEKVALDVALKKEVYGSARGIELNEQLIVLKTKEKILTSHTIDALKAGLQEKYDAEDENNLQNYGFPDDNPDLPVDKMHGIKAVMIDTFSPSHHCKLTDFLQVYLVQPWLAEQSVEDVRFEEQIATKELAIGTLREQIKGIKVQAKMNEMKKNANEKRIKDISLELEEKYDGREGEGESEMRDRMDKITQLQQERSGLEVENHMIVGGREDLAKQEVPLNYEVAKVAADIAKIQDSLTARAEARIKQSKLFFDLEAKACAELGPTASKAATDSETVIVEAGKHLQLCETYSSSDEVIAALIANKNIELFERVPINVPLQTKVHEVQALNHTFRPRTTATAICAVRSVVQVRLSVVRTNRDYYIAIKEMYDTEAQVLEEFHHKRAYYENALEIFNKYMVNSRRQRAMQLDITQRKKRLESLRDLRLQTMQEAKMRQIEKDRETANIKAAKEAAKKSTVTVVAQNAKKAIRAAKDKIRDLRYQNDIEMDEEEQKMAKNLREKSKEGVGSKPEAIREIKFTVGLPESELCQRQQDHLKEKGLPFFRRMQRSIGNQIYLWTQTTKDSSSFITHFELGHEDPENPNYKTPQMRKQRYELIDCPGCKMQIWVKRDHRRDYGIKNIQLTFTEEEENRLVVEKFTKIDISLSAFDLPDTYLWIEKIDKVKTVEVDNTNKLIAEIKKVKNLLDEKPNDKNIQTVIERLGQKLEAAYEKEKASEVTNPLQAATDLLALTEAELSRWMQVFQLIDKKRSGRITLMDIFEYFEETPTAITREVFLTTDSLDKEGYLEFGDFVRACGVFCLFGKKELVQFLYVFVDKDRGGYMTSEQYSEFLEQLHPYEKLRARRVLKQLRFPKGYHIDFKEFFELNDRFPAAYSPIFNLQNAMRKKTMGIDWWFQKMEKYKNVRRKMGAEGSNTAQLVEVELSRFTEDEQREKRMAERGAKIKQETSEFRKMFMQARQFMDEFS